MTIAQRFMRIPEILGDPEAEPPIVPLIPVCRSTWLAGVKAGIYPKPVRLSPRVVVWRSSDIFALFDQAPSDGHCSNTTHWGGADHG